MNFSDTELMMLEQLTYLEDTYKMTEVRAPQKEGYTVLERLEDFNLEELENYGEEGQQWAAVIRYIRGNEKLSSLKQGKKFLGPDGDILGTVYYPGDGATDAVVTFRGTTTARDWHDNGVGLGTSDTPVQQEALTYINDLPYDHITVVGHSKGGNLAQYTTICSDKVNKCISMDGQGFSGEFLEKYEDKIAKKGHLITNYSLATDFVHILLHPMPNSTQKYCAGSRVDGIAQNHYANSFFQYHTIEGGNHTVIVTDQNGPMVIDDVPENEMMTYLNKFTCYVLDTMPQEERVLMGDYVGNILQIAMEEGVSVNGHSDIWGYMMSDKEQFGKIVAYLIKYMENENLSEEEIQALESFLGWDDFFGDLLSVVDLSAITKELADGEEDKIIETALGLVNPEYKELWQEIESAYGSIPKGTKRTHSGGGRSFGAWGISTIAKYLASLFRGTTNVTRDFSDASKQKMLGLVTQVESEKWGNFTDWIGDRWYDFESWIGTLNIRNYINNVNTYHKKVIDKNNATEQTINRIFEAVWGVDASYATTLGNVRTSLKQWLRFVDTLSGIVEPGKGHFNGQYMASALNPVLKDVSKANVQQIKDQLVQNVSGEPVFDEELLLEYIKKNPAQMTDEEKQAVLDVIAELQGTVALYETAWSIRNDQLGADFWNRASWDSETTKYDSFSAVSAHYNNLYVSVLDGILEQGEDSNTFAASILKFSNGDTSLNILGAEASETVGKIFGSASVAAYAAKWKSEHTEWYLGKLEASGKTSFEASGDLDKIGPKDNFVEKWKETQDNKLKDKGLFEEEKETKYYDMETGEEIKDKDAPDFYSRQLTLGELKAGGQASVSAYDGTFDTWLGGELNVVVGEAEAHANVSAGAYIVGKDGERFFSPGVSAEAGVSVTAFKADYENQLLGNEMLGVNVDASVEALSASATGEININFMGKDKKGNVVLDPQIKAGVKAEAVLVEAEGSVGANVLGGEVAVKGSVKVGIGAKAEVGIKDGVVKCEVGASLGVGFDVGFEVDFGGMVNTVSDAVSSAWTSFQDGWNDFWG